MLLVLTLLCTADSSNSMIKAFHVSAKLLAVTVPIAFCGFMPDSIQSLSDNVLACVLPFHAYMGLNFVISDYIPPKFRVQTRILAFGAMFVAFAGLLNLNGNDKPGLAQTVKHLWKKSPKKESH